MQIRILSFEGCPNVQPAASLVREVLTDLGVPASLDHVEIHDDSESTRYRFLGSPSLQIDGEDIEMPRRGDAPYFGCRMYVNGSKRTGIPPKEMIVAAIERSRRAGQNSG